MAEAAPAAQSEVPESRSNLRSILIGAAFLMATSAIGPGFLTQTAVFTGQLRASFGFAILISVLFDLAAQLNIWRDIAVAEHRAQDVANALLPGLGTLLAILVSLGGLAFNIGNIAGAGLGMSAMLGTTVLQGALVSAVIGVALFVSREAGRAMDRFAQLLGFLMVALTLYVALASRPYHLRWRTSSARRRRHWARIAATRLPVGHKRNSHRVAHARPALSRRTRGRFAGAHARPSESAGVRVSSGDG